MHYGFADHGVRFGSIIWNVILVGVAFIVWLWVAKLWRDVRKKK